MLLVLPMMMIIWYDDIDDIVDDMINKSPIKIYNSNELLNRL